MKRTPLPGDQDNQVERTAQKTKELLEQVEIYPYLVGCLAGNLQCITHNPYGKSPKLKYCEFRGGLGCPPLLARL